MKEITMHDAQSQATAALTQPSSLVPHAPSLDRRRFLIGGGAALGLVVATVNGDADGQTASPPHAPTGPLPTNLGSWVAILPDDVVIIRCGRSEMGQGVHTGLATLVAEELSCRWEQVRVETGRPDAAFKNVAGGRNILAAHHGFALDEAEHGWLLTKIATLATEQFTGGSTSIIDGFVRAREAGAVARRMLTMAAARLWNVAEAECQARDGTIIHEASGRSLRFGEAASLVAGLAPPDSVTLKPRAQWTMIGASLPRIDIPAKVDGSALFASDVRLPGMVFAAMRHAPQLGSALARFKAESVTGMTGVQGVYPVPGGVAVVADNGWRARRAAQALEVEWTPSPHASLDDEAIAQAMRKALTGKPKQAAAKGDAGKAMATAAKTFALEFQVPYLAHATMEPQSCVAALSGGKLELWAPVQAQTRAVAAAAEAAGVKARDVILHTPYLGGGFGRRSETDFVVQAATLARLTGKPVQLAWSREEDMAHDFYRPAALCRIEAGLNAEGELVAWNQTLAVQSIMERVFPAATLMGPDPSMLEGADHLPYAIAHQRLDYAKVDLPVPVGPWRSVGHSQNAFFVESAIDEAAARAGRDPLELRRRLLADEPRLLAMLDILAEKTGWQPGQARTETAKGGKIGRGIALHRSFNAAVAQMVEVEIDDRGWLRVHRVVVVADCGLAVNPLIVESQLVSAIAYGLSAALYGAISFKQGKVQESNFTDYQVVRLTSMPKTEVHIMPSVHPPGGIGEPGLPPLAPALCNAIFAATGQRVTSLPLRRQFSIL
jgi:isoquinoline 1-oxidoreductase subunit beta